MTKSIRLRVVVPADNEATVIAVAENLREYLWSLGMKNLPVVAGVGSAENGSTDLAGPVRGPRVHWAAADVLMGAEPAPPPEPATRKKSGSSARNAAA